MFATWWIWALAALILGVLEIVAPTYILLGFAIGAGVLAAGLLTGLLSGLAASAYGVAWLVVLFAVFSLLAWLVLRLMFGKAGGSVKTFERDVND